MPGNAFIQFNAYGGTFPLGESEEVGHEGSKGWIEIADWDSIEARMEHLEEAMATGVFEPLTHHMAAPFRVTVVSPLE